MMEISELTDETSYKAKYPAETPAASLAWKSFSAAATSEADLSEPQVLAMVEFPKLGAAITKFKAEKATRAAWVKNIASDEEHAVESKGVRKAPAVSARFYIYS